MILHILMMQQACSASELPLAIGTHLKVPDIPFARWKRSPPQVSIAVGNPMKSSRQCCPQSASSALHA
eukprot:CAMPEP_0172673406 /NCGR_PEP_ID=MMETSP1074-20121228/12123_1 /TAXON_ID=2916 /ORGANISM="Ceratium fusus, Strain PA161109" /LENGTH=67 /DNA_ID=CAMNT_0013490697 /DNA_START=244 /DNA_END=448 /DNA_ORIENTATION=-